MIPREKTVTEATAALTMNDDDGVMLMDLRKRNVTVK
jgi:hypothetical protein